MSLRHSFGLVYGAATPLPFPFYQDRGAAALGWCGNTPARVVAACLVQGMWRRRAGGRSLLPFVCGLGWCIRSVWAGDGGVMVLKRTVVAGYAAACGFVGSWAFGVLTRKDGTGTRMFRYNRRWSSYSWLWLATSMIYIWHHSVPTMREFQVRPHLTCIVIITNHISYSELCTHTNSNVSTPWGT